MILPLLFQNDPGLVAWRRPDANGQSCVSCHSPDGIELDGFSREDVMRRAVRHLPKTEGETLVAFLGRRKANALGDRPLQPGGQPLGGVTPAQRDLAFLRELPKVVPTLTQGQVDSEAVALRVRDETLRVDLSALRVGFDFNRLSEDGFHGVEHRTIAHWLPDTPLPIDATVLAAQDRYLAEPSDENLRMLDATFRAQTPVPKTLGGLLSLRKYRALLILQHRLRTERLVALLPNESPFWDVADFARRAEGTTEVASLGFPVGIAAGKQGGPAFAEQLKALRLPWFWMAWTVDPALQKSGVEGETRRGDYFAESLWDDGPYPAHLAFMITKKLVEQGFDAHLWNEPRFPQGYEISLSELILGDHLEKLKLPPGEYQTRFELLVANAFRTSLYLERRDVRATGRAFHPEAQLNQVRRVADYLKRHGPLPGDGPLVKDLLVRLQAAKPNR